VTQTIGEPAHAGSHSDEGRRSNGTLLVLYLSLGGLAFAVLQSLVAPRCRPSGES